MSSEAPPPYDQATTSEVKQPPYPTEPSQNPGAYPPQSSAGAYPPASYPPPVQTAPGTYPAQQQGNFAPGTYPPQQQGGIVIVTQPVTVAVRHNNPYGYVPVNIQCPVCNQQTVTKISYENNGLVWISCGVTALFGCICGCCLIPFCVDAIKDVVHNCDKCGNRIGYRSRFD